MQTDVAFHKSLPKAEMLCRLAQHTPELDIETIQILTQIQSLGRGFSGLLGKDLEAYGLTEGKFFVLCNLHTEEYFGREAPGPSDIAEALGVTRGTITGLLDGLERDGYLERCDDLQDRRALTIRMTEKARDFIATFIPKSMLSLAKEIVLDKNQKRDLIEYLSRIEAAVEVLKHPLGSV